MLLTTVRLPVHLYVYRYIVITLIYCLIFLFVFYVYMLYNNFVLGLSLMISWRKTSWNPDRVPTVVTLCVCLSVRERATGHSFWPRKLIFGSFLRFYRHFSICSLCNTSIFLFSSYRSQFFTYECDIWVEQTLYHKELKTFGIFWKFHFLRLNR